MSVFADIVFLVPSITWQRVGIQSIFVDLKGVNYGCY